MLAVSELKETSDVAEANELLLLGWRLLRIVEPRRSLIRHLYILGAVTVEAITAEDRPTTSEAAELSKLCERSQDAAGCWPA